MVSLFPIHNTQPWEAPRDICSPLDIAGRLAKKLLELADHFGQAPRTASGSVCASPVTN
jgi:hypothetical protein